uniref:Uncharacterized protein n=1 Tax=Geladintestivirus 5 TaxID=3233137 RepID=A0AAU8MG70_9CAUD
MKENKIVKEKMKEKNVELCESEAMYQNPWG